MSINIKNIKNIETTLSSLTISDPCYICVSDYTSSNNKFSCSMCDYQYCICCLKRVIEMVSSSNITCPNCRQIIPSGDIGRVFSKKFFVDVYCSKVTDMFMIQQENMLVNDGPYIEYIIKHNQLMAHKKVITEDRKRYYMLLDQESMIVEESVRIVKDKDKHLPEDVKVANENIEKYTALRNQYTSYNSQLDKICVNRYHKKFSRNQYNNIKNQIYHISESFRCPCNGCTGIVTESSATCSQCNTVICVDCHEPRKNDHVCKKSDLDSVREVKMSSKPCPGCKVPISKIYGCDHMWCSQCHTKFSWNSGAIQRTTTNPHYYEWLRENGMEDVERQENLAAAGVIPEVQYQLEVLNSIFRSNISKISGKYRKSLLENILFFFIHYIGYQGNYEFEHLNLRIKYTQGEITYDTWKSRFKTLVKKDMKETEIAELVKEKYDIIKRVLIENDGDELVDKMYDLYSLVASQMEDAVKKYGMKRHIIDDEHHILKRKNDIDFGKD